MAAASPGTALRRLEWRVRHAADSVLAGEYRSALRGRGREFDQVVKYAYGDDVRDIDWNVTARLGEPYRKKFIEERELSVVLLFEDSLSLQFGSGSRSKREVLLEIAGLFALLAAGNRDRAGFWYAAPGGHHVRRSLRGRARVIRGMADLFARPVPDLAEAGPARIDWRLFRHAFPRHSVVVWLGDFPPRLAPEHWKALRRRYELIGVRVDDAWERELPREGLLPVLDPESGEIVPLDTRSPGVRSRHADWVARREAGFSELFPSALTRLVIGPDDDCLEALIRFFRARMRALRG